MMVLPPEIEARRISPEDKDRVFASVEAGLRSLDERRASPGNDDLDAIKSNLKTIQRLLSEDNFAMLEPTEYGEQLTIAVEEKEEIPNSDAPVVSDGDSEITSATPMIRLRLTRLTWRYVDGVFTPI